MKRTFSKIEKHKLVIDIHTRIIDKYLTNKPIVFIMKLMGISP